MKAMGRRAILRAIGVSPAAAVALPALVQGSGVTGVGVGVATYPWKGLNAAYTVAGSEAKARKFTSFMDWMAESGEAMLRREAKEMRGLDADISGMMLPLSTKIRWQQQRNFERLAEEKRNRINDIIKSRGSYEEY